MSIADHNRITALEARIAELERLVALLSQSPQRAAAERALRSVANQQSKELARDMQKVKRG